MENLDLNNLTCRVCLGNFDHSNSLYDFVEYEEKIELRKILKRVTNVQVVKDDDELQMTPTRICSNCTESLLNAYELVRQVEKSEAVLQNYIKKENKDILSTDSTAILKQEDSIKCVEDELVEDEEFETLEDEFQILSDTGQECFTYEISHDVSENEMESEEIELEYQENVDCTNSGEQENQIKEEKYETSKTNDSASHATEIEPKKESSANLNSTYQCEKCHRKFAKAETLKRHLKVAHTYATPEKIAAVVALIQNPPKEQFTCLHCPRTFARKDNLQRHLQVVHHVKIIQEMNTKKQPTYKRGLCPYCGESFSQASLVVHIRRHTGETPYICADCNKGFPRRQDLTIHQRKHTGERPHVCTVCGKTFSRPNKLTRHMRIHTGERPYKCTECDRSFAQSNDLNIHLRRHTGEKPYRCTVCGDAFISGTALKTHRKLKAHDAEENELSVDPFEKIRVNNRRRTVVEAMHKRVDITDQVKIEISDDP